MTMRRKTIDGMEYKIVGNRIPLDEVREILEAAIPEILRIECYQCVEEFIYNENLRLEAKGIKYKYVATPNSESGDCWPGLITVESITVVEVE